MIIYLICVMLMGSYLGKPLGQLCAKNPDCDSNCCVLTLTSSDDRIQYLCKDKEYCQGNLIYGSSCEKSVDCSSKCCFNGLCTEFDVCFQEYVKPIIDSLVISTAALLGVSTTLIWIWIILLCRKECKASEFQSRLKERIENILRRRSSQRLLRNTTNEPLQEETKNQT